MNDLIKRYQNSSVSLWSIIGGAALLAVAYVFAKNFADLRRYIKIERM